MSTVHINRPSSTRYVARVRQRGCRLYTVIGKPTKSYSVALMRMARAFASGHYHRGDVLVTADYYDPSLVAEIVKR